MRPALIVGAAACVHEDLSKLDAMAGPIEERFTVLAVNDGGVLWPGRLDHWVTLHPDELPEREVRRLEAGGAPGYVRWSTAGKVDREIPPDYRVDDGTSALLAAGVARCLGHDRVVLAGCPMEPQGYAIEHKHHGTGLWSHHRVYQESLPSVVKQNPWLREHVRSMSGFTRLLFGGPDPLWLRLEDA